MTAIRSKKALANLLAVGLLAAFSCACGWDNDTLAAESKGLPDLLDALVGRVPIYPKEYYEFRANRSSQIVKQDPTNLDELDNLIVAYDKLGDSKHAFFYADLKRKALLLTPNKEHEYRYYANLGTIEAHTWVRNKNYSDKTLLDRSIKNLKKCIEINPNAHFGREIVQVKLVELMREAKNIEEFPNEASQNDHLFENWDAWVTFVKATGAEKVQKGIVGIMTLGSGPDSPDLLCAVLPSLPKGAGHLVQLSEKRITDLWKSKPMFAGIGYRSNFHRPAEPKLFEKEYAALAENTKLYREKLSEFIKSKVSQGKHPDVDPHFWDDWKEPDHVNLKAMEPMFTRIQIMTAQVLACPALLIALAITTFVVMRRRRLNKSL